MKNQTHIGRPATEQIQLEPQTIFDVINLSDEVKFGVVLLVATGMFVVTEVYLKRAVDTGVLLYFAAAMVISVVANGLYLFIIKHSGLATGFVVSSVAMTFGVVLAGLFVFGEPWSLRKSAALVLLIAATCMLAWPENEVA